jgi:hypothetical protein
MCLRGAGLISGPFILGRKAMLKVGDQITIGNQLVEITYVMNEKAYGYKVVEKPKKIEAPVEEAPVEVKEEAPVEEVKRPRRGRKKA